MKTDTYLALCLEQAAHSSLHYRHGAIIVRGGKIIGQGFNDYRHGFDGGALQSGKIAKGTFDGPTIAELKHSMKNRPKHKHAINHACGATDGNSLVSFESSPGHGYHGNIVLSMHSEIMAIHSALSRSGALASSTIRSSKPSFKCDANASGSMSRQSATLLSKRGQCRDGAPGPKRRSGVLEPLHLNLVKLEEELWLGEDQNPEQEAARKDRDRSSRSDKFREGHRFRHFSDASTMHIRPEAPKTRRRCNSSLEGQGKSSMDHTIKFSGSDQERRTKTKSGLANSQDRFAAHSSEPVPMPKRRAKATIADRVRNTKLNGADLYVARFSGLGNASREREIRLRSPAKPRTTDPMSAVLKDSQPPAFSCSSNSDGSLHEELLNPCPESDERSAESVEEPPILASVCASKPCYRCVLYMHSVGIRRVFWTNASGKWQGAKMRDLVAVLDGDSSNGLGRNFGMFVTKHEILMMRRLISTH
ncbi:uncharacterized protein PV09_00967 [Verruconis gallopava]|uniref:CMP/dCMP-type deaminase domain-containing protein n=1 Tax=Verruconis gallopava TaxID=253628 RepID=A0A0D1Z512_9PEZI|nr:uncharacterized protein PV09_00967 [Verruconis gallopava]KIW08022.1 hypothetical protein PV09_00967 [Verruconis gallopava]